MKISAHYTTAKRFLTYLIGVITLLIGAALAFFVFNFTHSNTSTVVIVIFTLIFTVIFPYMHKISYYRMDRNDRLFHDGY